MASSPLHALVSTNNALLVENIAMTHSPMKYISGPSPGWTVDTTGQSSSISISSDWDWDETSIWQQLDCHFCHLLTADRQLMSAADDTDDEDEDA